MWATAPQSLPFRTFTTQRLSLVKIPALAIVFLLLPSSLLLSGISMKLSDVQGYEEAVVKDTIKNSDEGRRGNSRGLFKVGRAVPQW
jgi:hypothetical protein